jgi:hypothetical protein
VWNQGTSIIDYEGFVVATATGTGDVATAEIDLLASRDETVTPLCDAFGDRRPEVYAKMDQLLTKFGDYPRVIRAGVRRDRTIYSLPGDPRTTGRYVDQRHIDIPGAVKTAVSIPGLSTFSAFRADVIGEGGSLV